MGLLIATFVTNYLLADGTALFDYSLTLPQFIHPNSYFYSKYHLEIIIIHKINLDLASFLLHQKHFRPFLFFSKSECA